MFKAIAEALYEECGNQWKKDAGGLFRRSFTLRNEAGPFDEKPWNSKVFLTSRAGSIEGCV
ncbi:MAG TPA: hypothetical protein VIU64_18060 [Polyangia bacterium]